MKVIVAGGPRTRALGEELRRDGADVLAVVAGSAPAVAVADATASPDTVELLASLARADLLVLEAARDAVTGALVAACDRFGVRITVLCAREGDRRLAAVFGLRCADADAPAAAVLDPGAPAPSAAATRGRIIAVWGAAGAPGRTTIAMALAAELARDGRRVALVDADSHAPAIALATGLADEGPGFASACRQAARGGLTVAELERIAAPLGELRVLTGINRPSRWPELAEERVTAALEACRDWADDTVVDVASSLEQDEEILSDLDGPRRNAATLGALRSADLVVAVVAADPIGMARFVRAHAELRAIVPGTTVRVLINKTRSAALGVDPRGQVRRTLERYTGVEGAWFAPSDPRAADAALLSAQPVLRAAGRSALTAAVRRFVGEAIDPPARTITRRGTRAGRRSSPLSRSA